MLDLRTLVLVGAALALVGAVVLTAVARISPYRGVSHWALAATSIATAFLLMGLRGLIPDWISIVVANSLALCGCLLTWMGMRAFACQRPVSFLWPGAVLAFFVPLLWVVAHFGSLSERTVVILAFCAVPLYGAGVELMRRGEDEHLVTRVLLTVLVFEHATALLFRLMLEPLADKSSMFAGGLLQQLYLLETALFTPAFSTIAAALVAEKALRAVDTQSLFDTEAGHFNAAGFAMMLDKELARGRRETLPLVALVVIFDATVHGTAGGPLGGPGLPRPVDRRFHALCRQILREEDTLGHLADGRYAVILPNTRMEDGLRIAHRLRTAVAGGSARGEPVRTVSVGVAGAISGVAAGGNVLAAAVEAAERAASEGGNLVERASMPVDFARAGL